MAELNNQKKVLIMDTTHSDVEIQIQANLLTSTLQILYLEKRNALNETSPNLWKSTFASFDSPVAPSRITQSLKVLCL